MLYAKQLPDKMIPKNRPDRKSACKDTLKDNNGRVPFLIIAMNQAPPPFTVAINTLRFEVSSFTEMAIRMTPKNLRRI